LFIFIIKTFRYNLIYLRNNITQGNFVNCHATQSHDLHSPELFVACNMTQTAINDIFVLATIIGIVMGVTFIFFMGAGLAFYYFTKENLFLQQIVMRCGNRCP